MSNRNAVYAEIVDQAIQALEKGVFIPIADLVGTLNKKGLRSRDGGLYTTGRGAYRTVSCAYAWAKRFRGSKVADAVAEAVVTPLGHRAWDPERRKVV